MKITLDSVIGDIIDYDPDLADIFVEYGMHCVSCPVSRMETVAEACEVHGLEAEDLIEKLNEYLETK